MQAGSYSGVSRFRAFGVGVGFAVLLASSVAGAQTDSTGDIAINPNSAAESRYVVGAAPGIAELAGTSAPIFLRDRDILSSFNDVGLGERVDIGVEAMRLGGLSIGPVVSVPTAEGGGTGAILAGEDTESTQLGGFLRYDTGDFAAELRIRGDVGGLEPETSADLGIGYTTRLGEDIRLTTGVAAQLLAPSHADTVVGVRDDRLGPTGFTVLEPGQDDADFAASLGFTLSFDFDLDLTLTGTYSRPDPSFAEGVSAEEQDDRFFTGIGLRYSF